MLAKQQELSLMAGGNAEWRSYFGNSLALFDKVKHRPSNHTSRWNM